MKDKFLKILKNNKFDLFIIILASLVVLFFIFTLFFHPEYVYAADSVSDDEAYIQWTKDNVEVISNQLGQRGYVMNPDFYLISDDSLNPTLWDQFLRNWGIEGTTVGKPPARAAYDYAVSNNMTIQDIYNDCFDIVYNYVQSECPYYIYDFININDFFSYYNFSSYTSVNSNLSTFKTAFENACSDSDFVYLFSSKSRSGMNYLYDSTLVKIPRSFFDSCYLVLSEGSFSDIVNFGFQSFRIPSDGSLIPSTVNLNGFLSLYDGFSYVYSFDGLEIYDIISANGGDNFGSITRFLGELNSYSFRIGLIQNSTGWFSNQSFMGTCFIYSGESFSAPVFRSTNLASQFFSGNSPVYQFNPSVDFGDKAGDINFGDLYTFLSNNIDFSLGDISAQINGLANDYLEEQLEILHDINNALNDSYGHSWLKKIFMLLESEFPLLKFQNNVITQKLDDIVDAINNISFDGSGETGSGSGHGTNYTQQLTTISDELASLNVVAGLIYADMILQPDAEEEPDFDDLLTVAGSRFPFCLVADVVTVVEIFNAEPVKPDLQMPVPFQPGETWTIDLSFYDGMRPWVFAIITIGFIIFLISLTLKIFEALKG